MEASERDRKGKSGKSRRRRQKKAQRYDDDEQQQQQQQQQGPASLWETSLVGQATVVEVACTGAEMTSKRGREPKTVDVTDSVCAVNAFTSAAASYHLSLRQR